MSTIGVSTSEKHATELRCGFWPEVGRGRGRGEEKKEKEVKDDGLGRKKVKRTCGNATTTKTTTTTRDQKTREKKRQKKKSAS